jgi:hypothetical protein
MTTVLLSGCASQVSVDQSIAVLEYEKCLDFYIQSAMAGNYIGISGSLLERQKEDQVAYRYWVLEPCQSRRP